MRVFLHLQILLWTLRHDRQADNRPAKLTPAVFDKTVKRDQSALVY